MRKFLFLFSIVLGTISVIGQDKKDSLSVSFSLGTIQSSEDFAPFLLEYNRWGAVDAEQALFATGSLNYDYHLGDKWQFSTGFEFRNDRAISYYAKGNYDFVDLTIGAYKTTIGGLDSELTLVNYGLSRNAAPVPMIEATMNRFLAVPFTNGIMKFRARMGHRWLEKNRFQSKALMHNKDIYVMFDFNRSIGFEITTGLVHIAQYGGTAPYGIEQPSDLSTFWDVFLGRGASVGPGTAGENNARGNHLGIYEIIFRKRLKDHLLTLDYQSPFEDKGSMQYVSLKNYLVALNWQLPDRIPWLKEVQVEVTSSMQQSGPGIPDPTVNYPTVEANFGYKFGGRDDYHNNWLYRSGYTFKNYIMGNPLFFTYEWTQNFLGPYKDYEVVVQNNRIRALVVSALGDITNNISYRVQFVRSENYGSYKGLYDGRFNWGGVKIDPFYDYDFKNGKVQHVSLLDLNVKELFKSSHIGARAMFAYDFGELYNNFGMEISMLYFLENN